MVNQSRQFFVGGNFKMNGSVKSVSDLIKGMNEAKLDGKTGESRLKASCFCSALEDTAKTGERYLVVRCGASHKNEADTTCNVLLDVFFFSHRRGCRRPSRLVPPPSLQRGPTPHPNLRPELPHGRLRSFHRRNCSCPTRRRSNPLGNHRSF